jgi:pimeloyl-ACP methyl ester carboxylesterase
MRGLIVQKHYEIEYFEYGYGSKIVFAFHGFNNHAEDFKPLADLIEKNYKVIAINLFFHGESRIQNNFVEEGFSVDDLQTLFNHFSKIYPSEKYTLIGYSLGGRIVLKLFEIIPERIEKIVLLAPDGIKISPVYRLLTQNKVGQKLLKRVIEKPSFFFALAKFLKSTRLISDKKYAFGINNFDTRKKREKVYQVWMIFRDIISKTENLKAIIKKYKIPVHLFFGKQDKVIPSSIGINFQKGINEFVFLHNLDSGHRLLIEKNLKDISAVFK